MKEPESFEVDGRHYRLRLHETTRSIDGRAWDDLLAKQAHPTPFLLMSYLRSLEDSGSACEDTGWRPLFLTLESASAPHVLQAACPAYLKAHSYGEYVFDWAWADAYRRHGLRYYPKLLLAVPFTPVSGTRLLAVDRAARAALAEALLLTARTLRVSSAHALFLAPEDQQTFEQAGWMLRRGVQFHWQSDPASPALDFDDWLRRLHRDKRKKIQQERRRVREAGIEFSVHEGREIDRALWDLFNRCYQSTYAAHHATPYLTRAFFDAMADRMPEHWLMFVAHREGRAIGCSLLAIDRARRTAWGRYWGCQEPVPLLHFEACYYQPLAWCIENRFEQFEGGAQGEHKMARGLLPARTHSAHWLRDERFADAVRDFLAQEEVGVERYVDELNERTPFKPGALPPEPSASS